MKTFLQIASIVFLSVITTKAQTVVYADSVIAFSTEYSASNWSAKKIIGTPNVHPLCEDNVQAWAPTSGSGGRNWIELYYSTPINVDTISIYETFNDGAIDTVYLRNAVTQSWNVVYTNTAVFNSTCHVLKIGMSQTLFTVDALRFSLNLTTTFQEYDAVSLKSNSPTTSVYESSKLNILFAMYPNPTKDNITIKLNNTSASNNLAIYSVLGNKVYEQKLLNDVETVEPKLPQGIYFVEVTNAINKKSINKLIIE